ncbi:hypothetical protein TRFO_34428 [Tritrichomonas foetus]|uniref:C2 NT-type domain-containing protein n=1 Tax=Tritrichomonas foetus TaxID=1144522 RepID=A0A1J4JL94_9EUKA|nr:hypothetical protein TRFO_34428 [Tritrichomonas foetus]|eukprot:OHS99183.1 hypothetical protein TRFO_34428 [Tritrichomonas foetus]
MVKSQNFSMNEELSNSNIATISSQQNASANNASSSSTSTQSPSVNNLTSFSSNTGNNSNISNTNNNSNNSNTNSNTSNTSSSPNNSTKRPKASIKNIIHNLFKPGISTQLRIRNMLLTDIPTQETRIYIRVKQGRNRQSSQLVKIIGNSASWSDEILIDCRVPTKQHSKRSFSLRFSFRLEDISGRSHTRYGFAELDLVSITMANDWEYKTKLHDCNYKSNFSCLISVKVKKQSEDPNMSGNNFSLNSCPQGSLSDNNLVSQNAPSNATSADAPSKSGTPAKPIINSSSMDRIPKGPMKTIHLISRKKHRKFNKINNQSILLPDKRISPLFETSRIASEVEAELPFRVQQVRLDRLTKQVDDIISSVLYASE